MGRMPSRPPTDSVGWRGDRDRLKQVIDDIRIVIPLLDRRVRESGEPGGVELEDAVVGVRRSAEAVEVQLVAPWCSEAEAARLIAIVAACVAPTPGWQLARDSDQRPIGAVLAIRAHDAHPV